MAQRPLINVQFTPALAPKTAQVQMPAVFASPIRPDIVNFVFTQMNKNRRQAYAVSPLAGKQATAESWGTGRAVARVPRVTGSGTHRAGQGAFANMCRGGRLFSPTKTYRKWHKRINKNERRVAVCAALAATANASLVMARGHRIGKLAEVPFVVADEVINPVKHTKAAVQVLKDLHCFDDCNKVDATKKLRVGRGKSRNRRYQQRVGPLMVYGKNAEVVAPFRNIPGMDFCNVTRLNLLQLTPGGHLGRFVIWTQDAFQQLDDVFGTPSKASVQKKNYHPPTPMMTNSDITRIINSPAVQSVLKEKGPTRQRTRASRKNPLRNTQQMIKLNPYTATVRRHELMTEKANKEKRDKLIAKKRAWKLAHPAKADEKKQ